MEIHAPHGPMHSLKDFAVHILVVTAGILIAFGLDGVREYFRERRLVRETRVAFHDEIANDREESSDGLKRVSAGRDTLRAIVENMPALALQHPDQLEQQINAVQKR